MLALSSPGTRVLLVGTGRHVHGSPLPNVPAVADTVRAVGQVLVERCGLAEAHRRMLVDPEDPLALGSALTEVAEQASDVLLFYYVGHGLVSPSGELHLATRATDHLTSGLAYKALPYSAVRDALTACRAESIIVVLDCCFSGLAYGSFGTVVADAFELTYVRGSYLLTSASGEEEALAPAGERYTAFSGELLRLLREGDPAGPRELTLDHVYRYLYRALSEHGFPQPHRQASDRAGDLVLASNPAYCPRPASQRLVAPPDEAGRAVAETCPYRGLDAFRTEDARYFFGREKLTAELVRRLAERLSNPGPLVVVGPSGSGKSSLLHAGLLPALRRGEAPASGSRTWPHLCLTPGDHPVGKIASLVAGPAGMDPEALRAELSADPCRFPAVLRRVLRERAGGREVPGGRVVLVVDQFEELFTACQDEEERRAFIRALCAACGPSAARTEPPALVVLGVRADFYGHCMAYPELVPALRDGQVMVGPMTVDEQREAIEKPAEVAGLVLEEGLADLLLRDLSSGRQPGHDSGGTLPLLSFALLATWQQREGHLLTLAGYQASGGIWNAVAQTAERVYEGLDEEGQRAARFILLRMVRVGQGTEDTRRRLPRAGLLAERPAHEAATVTRVLDELADARLITLGEDTAEITHEALLRAWPRLRGWIDEDRAGLLIRQQLADAAEAWHRENHDPAALYRGTRLAAARQWAEEHRYDLSSREQDFLHASVRTERRRTRTRRLVVTGIVGLVLLAMTASVVAFQQRRAAQRRDALIASRQIALQADAVRGSDPAAALQLSLSAYRIAPTPEARAGLFTSYTTPYPTVLTGHTRRVLRLAYSADGRTLATASADRTVRLWDVTDPYHPAAGAVLSTGSTAAIAFSPRDHLLAARSRGSLQLWDVTDARHPVAKAVLAAEAADPGFSAAFSPDGKTLATVNDSGEGTVRLWDLTDPSRPVTQATLRISTGEVFSVAFSPDGKALATGSAIAGDTGALVRLWDVTDPRHPVAGTVLTAKSAFSVAFSPHGHLLAAGGVIGSLRLWDVSDRRHPVEKTITEAPDTRGNILSVAFSPDGKTLVASSSNGTVSRLDVSDISATPSALPSLPGDTPVYAVAFSPDGHSLATGGEGGVVRVWNTPSPPLLPGGIDKDAPGSAFSPDGRLLVTNSGADDAATAQLWNVTDPHRPTLIAALPSPWTHGAFLSDGRTLISLDKDRSSLRLWDVGDPRHPVAEATFPKPGPKDGAYIVAVSPDTRTIALGNSYQNVVHLWDVTDRRHPVAVATITTTAPASGVAFSGDLHRLITFDDRDGIRLWNVTDPRHPVATGAIPDTTGFVAEDCCAVKNTLATMRFDGPTRLWDMTDQRRPVALASLESPTKYILLVNDHTLATTTSNDGAVHLWDITDPRHPIALAALTTDTAVNWLYRSPDRRTLAGSSSDAVYLWDVADPRNVSVLATFPNFVDDAEFSPDDHVIAGDFSDDGFRTGVRLWDLDSARLYRYLCSVAPRSMTPAQWKKLAPNVPYQPSCG
ncbi:putative WD-40 repeat protein [Carbonactinospora thermoautotrophica]|uniref:Putative WD-40 repeat protein n=1 Tax=Carbonactinospora thermoautotrophica TaxID=1469144 RepID=A0A132MLD0_9ACTN|nr:AAA family ATPase [Carbonactinospora thermoautotrophica]KWW98593.1 putative WD-40 repeat protein [Carbonactinospora thermoautotrophica]